MSDERRDMEAEVQRLIDVAARHVDQLNDETGSDPQKAAFVVMLMQQLLVIHSDLGEDDMLRAAIASKNVLEHAKLVLRPRPGSGTPS